MKKTLSQVGSVFLILTLVISTFHMNVQIVSVAQADTQSGDSNGLLSTLSLPSLPSLPNIFEGLNFGGANSSVVTGGSAVTCQITANNTQVVAGGSVTLSWNTPNATTITINGQPVSGTTGSIVMSNIQANTTYTIQASGGGSSCTASVTVICLPAPVDCRLELTKAVDKTRVAVGETLTYTLTIRNVGTTNCTGSGVKIEDVLSDKLTFVSSAASSNIMLGYDGGVPPFTPANRTVHFNGDTLTPGEQGTMTIVARVATPSTCGAFDIPNQARATAWELNRYGTWVSSGTVTTTVQNDCPPQPAAPICNSFTATPSTIEAGQSATLNWTTTNATQVSINNGIGIVANNGSRAVSPTTSTTYVLTVTGTNNQSVNCSVPVTVTNTPPPPAAPICNSFTATPSVLTAGQSTTLAWTTTNATRVVINNGVGEVPLSGSRAVTPLASTTYIATVFGTNNQSTTCQVPVVISTPPPQSNLTCEGNVTFTSSATTLNRGDVATLTWNTTNVDSVSISPIGINALSGSATVDPTSNTTYTLTARRGAQSVDCPLTIRVNTPSGGGGGGGSAVPRCDLTISDNRVRAGEEVTLSWRGTNVTDVVIRDNQGNTLVTTEGLLRSDKREKFSGSIKIRPTRNTEYTMNAERGSRDRVCTVRVTVDDIQVITQPQPLVAGIALSNVPYTGFEAGPFLTATFYALLVAWALFVAYLIVVRSKTQVRTVANYAPIVTPSHPVEASAERYPDLFPAVTVASVAAPAVVPTNLPTGTPIIGYENVVASHQDSVLTDLENRAHEQRALLSTDAVRYFIANTQSEVERNQALDTVIAEAKATYPLEDGWIVINEARMRNLCLTCVANYTASEKESFIPQTISAGKSSLAEAIVTGNVVAAYEMIGNRPMFALADAAADFDNVIRIRKGGVATVSQLLATETTKLSDEKIHNIIAALTGALDGTYTDEASAVKMAIMKAVKEVA